MHLLYQCRGAVSVRACWVTLTPSRAIVFYALGKFYVKTNICGPLRIKQFISFNAFPWLSHWSSWIKSCVLSRFLLTNCNWVQTGIRCEQDSLRNPGLRHQVLETPFMFFHVLLSVPPSLPFITSTRESMVIYICFPLQKL